MDKTERKTEVLLRMREFLTADRLDAMKVYLERDGNLNEPPFYSAGIHLEEQGQGHFCFETFDLEEMAAYAGKIAAQASALRHACLLALEGDLQCRLEREG